MKAGESFESFPTVFTLKLLLHPGGLCALDQVVCGHLAGGDEMLTQRTVMFGRVGVHLEVVVQAGLAVERPAAVLTPPAPSPPLQSPGVPWSQEARGAQLAGGRQVLPNLQVQPRESELSTTMSRIVLRSYYASNLMPLRTS